jgi:NIMA (never in mitosis gene a)-related kinase
MKVLIFSLKANARKGAFREVSLMKTLSHPNIIKYKSSFFDENNLYIAMEYAEKGDLSQVMFRFIQLIKSRRQKNSPFT